LLPLEAIEKHGQFSCHYTFLVFGNLSEACRNSLAGHGPLCPAVFVADSATRQGMIGTMLITFPCHTHTGYNPGNFVEMETILRQEESEDGTHCFGTWDLP
jgi:hypothetical protein